MTQEEKQLLLNELCARLPHYTMIFMGDGAMVDTKSIADIFHPTSSQCPTMNFSKSLKRKIRNGKRSKKGKTRKGLPKKRKGVGLSMRNLKRSSENKCLENLIYV